MNPGNLFVHLLMVENDGEIRQAWRFLEKAHADYRNLGYDCNINHTEMRLSIVAVLLQYLWR